MSIDTCQRCGAYVDTDDEPESYVQIADMKQREEWICLCRRHREQWEEEHSPPDEPDELEAAQAFHELEGERLRAARDARLKEEANGPR